MKKLVLAIFVSLMAVSTMGCSAKKLDKKLCDALVKKGTECKMPLFLVGIEATCKQNMDKKISDYDKLEKWSKMPCEELKKSWAKVLEDAKNKK
jgi:hypothetical protein